MNTLRLEDRLNPAPLPVANINAPATVPLGGQFNFTVGFDNASANPADVGYGPVLFLWVPQTGTDWNVGPSFAPDGITLKASDPSFLGSPLPYREVIDIGAAEFISGIELPYFKNDKLENFKIFPPTGVNPGDKLYVIELPFGSFTPSQPEAVVTISANLSNLADMNTPVNIRATAGFIYGADPLFNPGTDQMILQGGSIDGSGNILGYATSAAAVEPSLYTVTIANDRPESETATGRNYPITYTVTFDGVTGQKFNALELYGLLQKNLYYIPGTASVSFPNGYSGGHTLTEPGAFATQTDDRDDNTFDANDLKVVLNSTLTAGDGPDVVLTFQTFAPLFDLGGIMGPIPMVIDPVTGDDVITNTMAKVGGTWTPIDTRDPIAVLSTVGESKATDTLTLKSVAIQKPEMIVQNDVAPLGTPSPGDTLQMRMNFQVSDYFAFDDLIVTDIFGDGHRWDTSFVPTLSMTGRFTLSAAAFTKANYDVNQKFTGATADAANRLFVSPVDPLGTTEVVFRLSDELISRGYQSHGVGTVNGRLVGGDVQNNGERDGDQFTSALAPTKGSIVFRTIVQQEFSDEYKTLGTDSFVDQGDVLKNYSAVIDGAVLKVGLGVGTNFTATGEREADDTSNSISINTGNLKKIIYAINGIKASEMGLGYNDLDGFPTSTRIAPGDRVTYRFTYTHSFSNFENFSFTDYLPLPIYNVSEFGMSPTVGAETAVPPVAGKIVLGPNNTYDTDFLTGTTPTSPTVTLDTAGNSFKVQYGTYDDPLDRSSVMDILFTVTASKAPFSDGVLMTNQVRASRDSTNAGTQIEDAIIQIVMTEPNLRIWTGVVSTSNPAADQYMLPLPNRNDLFVPPFLSPNLHGMGGASSFAAPGTDGSLPAFTGTITSEALNSTAVVGGKSRPFFYLNENAVDLDAGDLVRFAIVVENKGSSRKGAFDTQIRALLPDGMQFPGGSAANLNLRVTDGTGALISFTKTDGSGWVSDADLFAGGLELVDPGPTAAYDGAKYFEGIGGGAIDGYDPSASWYVAGRNVVIITYDLQIKSDASPSQNPDTDYKLRTRFVSTAILEDYASADNSLSGFGYLPGANKLQEKAHVAIRELKPEKEIAATSEAHTPETGDGSSNANARLVTIGEIVRYRLRVEIPEGEHGVVTLTDYLPNGLRFLETADNKVTIAFVSTAAGKITSNTLSGVPTIIGNSGTVADVPIGSVTFALPPSAYTAGPYASGTDITFNLGKLSNAERDDDVEYVLIDFNVVVTNETANQSTNIRSNRFDLFLDGTKMDGEAKSTAYPGNFSDGTAEGSSNIVRVKIVEPTLSISTDITNFVPSVTKVDRDDEVYYAVTITNPSTNPVGGAAITAFDLSLTSLIPSPQLIDVAFAKFGGGPTLVNTDPGSTATPTITGDNTVGYTVSLTADQLAAGKSITLYFKGIVSVNVTPDEVITTTPNVKWTSLPGTGTAVSTLVTPTFNVTGSKTPGGSGSANGERNGSDVPASVSDLTYPGKNSILNNYGVAEPESFQIATIQLVKDIVATSEAHTTGLNGGTVTIGEIVRYRLELKLPESTSYSTYIRDVLPAGMIFLNDGTAKVGFVSNNGFTSDLFDINALGANITGNTASLATAANMKVLPDAAVSSSPTSNVDVYNPGSAVYFRFGTLANNDNDADTPTTGEYVVIEFNAIVANVTDNQSGTTLKNSADYNRKDKADNSFVVNGDNTVTVTVREPSVTIATQVKTTGPYGENVTVDAGDTVTFEMVVTNSSAANTLTAFDLISKNVLPAGLTLVVGTVTTSAGTITKGNTAGDTFVQIDNSSLASGGSVTITFQATVDPTNPPYAVLTDTGKVTYTSIPGNGTAPNATGSVVPGTSGAVNGERDGTTTPLSLNDYLHSDPATVTMSAPSFDKELMATDLTHTSGSQVTIGERITYGLIVTLPEGTTPNITIVDLLPDGLKYVAGSVTVITTAAASGGKLAADFNGTVPSPTVTGGATDGADVTITFGSTSVTADNVTSNNSFLITLQADVTNVVGNVGLNPPGLTSLPNAATLKIGANPVVNSDTVTVTVVEPQLKIIKDVDLAAVDPGDTVTFTITVSHTAASQLAAYDVTISDALRTLLSPRGYDLIAGSVTITADAGVVNPVLVVGNTAGDTTVKFTADEIPLGKSVKIGLQAVTIIPNDPHAGAPNVSLPNVATVTFDNAPGTPPSGIQRSGSKTDDATTKIVAYGISGYVYEDDNLNGVRNMGEAGIATVKMVLTGTDLYGNAVNTFIFTDANGYYEFAGLKPSNAAGYTVTQFAQPIGYFDGKETAGTFPAPIGATGIANNPGDSISSIVITKAGVSLTGTEYNFGEVRPASVSGFVWDDVNQNGQVDVGEPRISGVTITLTGTSYDGTAITLTTTTGADGKYEFANLKPSDATGYVITETQPAAYFDDLDYVGKVNGVTTGTLNGNDSFKGVVLFPNKVGADYNFAEVTKSAISGYVFEDKNNNNVFDVGEPGINGVTVTLLYAGPDGDFATAGDNQTFITTTGTDGKYEFLGLYPGKYKITQSQPATYLDGQDKLGTITDPFSNSSVGTLSFDKVAFPTYGITATGNDVFTDVVLGRGGSVGQNYNFGELKPATVSGYVYDDANNNGVFDVGEAPIGNVTVTISGTDDFGAITPFIAVTDVNGKYVFPNLRPGTYTLTQTQPAGFLDGIDSVGKVDSVTTGSKGGTSPNFDVFTGIVVASGQEGVNYNFGELAPGLISGYVYRDFNNDGVRDAGETGIGGVTVTLTGTDDRGPVSITLTTNPDGYYEFPNLRPGTYSIQETQPAGFFDGIDAAGSVTAGSGTKGTVIDNYPAGNDTISGVVLLTSGTQVTENNFGELPPASISGKVFDDRNNDGLFNGSDLPIGGVTITLTGTNDKGEAVSLVAVTNPDGTYEFTGLRPSNAGGYKLVQTQPVGYLDGIDTVGSKGGTPTNAPVTGNDTVAAIVIAAGNTATGYNFAEIKPSAITGFVYEDLNGDGVYNIGTDTPIANAKVTLTGTNDLGDPISVDVLTDATGLYQFLNLRPGTYKLTQTQPGYLDAMIPVAYLDGQDKVGTNFGGTLLGDPNFGNTLTGNDVMSGLVIANNQVGLTGANYNFGELKPSSLKGNVWEDDNNDGVFDFTDLNANNQWDAGEGERPIAGVQLTLTGKNDRGEAVSVTTTTDALGRYAFPGLRPSFPGTGYKITETQPSYTIPAVGTFLYFDGLFSPVIGSQGGTSSGVNAIVTTPILSGTNGVNNNFPELVRSKISGTVYRDDDNDGFIDAGETGISDVVITLTGTDDLGQSVTITTKTDSNGNYQFTDLRPGSYKITQTQPPGYDDGLDRYGGYGSNGTLDVNGLSPLNDQLPLVLLANVNATNNNFGEIDLPPTINAVDGTSIGCEGGIFSQNTTFIDAPQDGSWTVMVDYGDPYSATSVKTFTIQAKPGVTVYPLNLGYTYAKVGLYEVTVTISDGQPAARQKVSEKKVLVNWKVPTLIETAPSAMNGSMASGAWTMASATVGSIPVMSMMDRITLRLPYGTPVSASDFTMSSVKSGNNPMSWAGTLPTKALSVISRDYGDVNNGYRLVAIQYVGSNIFGGSLPDGKWTLSSPWGSWQYYRFFGDFNADGKVNDTDLKAFREAERSTAGMTNYKTYFDFDMDCDVDAVDYREFQRRYRYRIN